MTPEQWRAMIASDLPERFSVPPECQGQTVEYAYAGGAEGIFERITDFSDTASGVTINVYAYKEDTEECMEACEPWNRTPRLGELLWSENTTAS